VPKFLILGNYITYILKHIYVCIFVNNYIDLIFVLSIISRCSSGYWTLEMATEFPLAKFYGVDSTKNFPDSVMPKNAEFILANIINDGLPFKAAEFDYVFGRNLIHAFQTPILKSIVIKELL
jgi:hypothetical protein